jgi:hypothetical protein
MDPMSYEDAIDFLANKAMESYTVDEMKQLAYDTIYDQLEKDYYLLVKEAAKNNIVIID